MTERVAAVMLLLLLLLAGAARAEPRSLPLDPAHAQIEFRTYAFGVMPINGSFTRFSGVLTIDPLAPQTCRVDIRVEVASLRMLYPAVGEDVLSRNLLDAAAFPTLAYSGACAGAGIEGALTLHGTTKPLHLAIVSEPPYYRAEATLRRRDWGITGRPLLAGATVRIRVSTTISP
jgi:polyisoprenoid-binding protein YceI